MSKTSYRVGVFLGHKSNIVIFVALFVALYVLYSVWPEPMTMSPSTVKIERSESPSELLHKTTMPGQKIPDPCESGQAERFQEASQFLKMKKYDEATDLLYKCVKSLSTSERELYVKALTLGNAARSKAADAEIKRDKADKKRKGVSLGMSQQDVIDSSWGKPRDINRTIGSYGTHEQWVYGGGYLYFENGILKTIQN